MALLGTARGFARSVANKQRLAHMIAGRVDGTGTASILAGGSEMTLTDNGTGDYTLTFSVPFKRVPVVVASALNAAAVAITISTVSVSSVRLLAWDAAGVAIDTDFHVMIMGFDSADQV